MKKSFILSIMTLLILSSLSFATDYTGIYDELKSDYPTVINKLQSSGATDTEVKNFLNEVSNRIEASGSLTTANFDSKMYNAMLDVLGVDPSEGDYVVNDAYYNLGIAMINNYMSVLTSKTLTGDLADLRNVVMNRLITSTSTAGSAAVAGSAVVTAEESTAEIVYGVTTDKLGSKVTLNQTVLNQLVEKTDTKKLNLSLSELELNKGERIDLEGVSELFNTVDRVTLNMDDVSISLVSDSYTPLANKVIDIQYLDGVLSFDWETTTSVKSKSLYQPVAFSLPYAQEVLDETLTVVKVESDGTTTPVGGYFDGETVSFFTDEPGDYKVVSNPVEFDDFSLNDYWAIRKVERLACAGIIGGRSEGVFDPEASITRAEFATLVTKMAQFDESSDDFDFSDVSSDAWYAPYVSVAYEFGLMSGRGDGIFDPDAPVTQQEILIVLSKILEQRGVSLGSEESDSSYTLKTANASDWANDYIENAISNGALSDIPLKYVDMSKAATRLETANMLYEIQEELFK